LIIGPIPAAIFIAAMLLIERYPIDEAAYNAIVGAKASK
jgi:Na+/melibiose symporter-like transporter